MKIVKYVHRLYFPIFSLIAITIYGLQYFDYPLPRVVNNYMNDFLCLPIVLFICLYISRWLKRDNSMMIPLSLQIVVTMIFSFYFEYFLPTVNDRYTADGYDVILYFSGMLFFYIIEGKGIVNKGAYSSI